MKKPLPLIPWAALLSLCFVFQTVSAQRLGIAQKNREITPGGLFDTVADHLGRKFSLNEIAIDDSVRNSVGSYKSTTVASSCSSGYFQLYLETGSGMEGTDPVSTARLNVLCQVLNDISRFINSPCTATGQKINIWVRDPSAMGGGFLGVAASYYSMPAVTSASGIIDNAIWITANSGRDAYTNITSPLYMTSGGAGSGSAWFHGQMAFKCDSTIHWHTDLTTAPLAGEYDLYTVALHEIMHALGFMSLVDYNGSSRFSSLNYYDRYDLHLKTPGGANLLVGSTPSCDLYNWGFNPALSASAVVSPGSTAATCPSGYQTGPFVNHTVCANAVKYVGSTTQPVYTPSCYEKGSSLSHFEDECSVPTGFTPAPPASNDQYFVMCNASTLGPYSSATPGAMKRYIAPEERAVLCDIGYKVNTTYGNTTHFSYKNYGGSVCGEQVAGINDGISGGVFTFYGVLGSTININGGPTSLLSNDYGATSFKCLEVVVGGGTLSATSGTSTTLVTYSPTPGCFGVQLLRYIPVSSSGVEGNITYVYIVIGDGNCTPSLCNMVNNGDFESVIGTGCTNVDISTALHCWAPYMQSPDLFGTSSSCGSYLSIPATMFSPTINIHPFSTLPNNHFLGLIGRSLSGPGTLPDSYVLEAADVSLSSSLVPGQKYVISFWAVMGNIGPTTALPAVIQFAVSPSMAPLPYYGMSTVALPPSLTSLCTMPISHPNQWHYYTQTITYTGPIANTLVVLNASYLNPASFGAAYSTYMFLDDISIKPLGSTVTFSLPDTICYSYGPINLKSMVSAPGGTFSWDSSSFVITAHDTLFDPVAAYNATTSNPSPGTVVVCYSYTDGTGCTQNVCASTQVVPTLFSATVAPVPICPGGTVTLTATGTPGFNYTWAPSVTCLTPPCDMATATPTITTTYTVTETTTRCKALATAVVTLTADIIGPATLCVGSTIALTNAVPAGTWTSSNMAVATVSATGTVTGISPGTSAISYVNPCDGIAVKVITVNPLPAAITGTTSITNGSSTTLSNPVPGGSWTSSNPAVASIGSSSGIVSGIASGTTIVTYTLPTGCFTTKIVTVKPTAGVTSLPGSNAVISIAPNPNKGSFTITGFFHSENAIDDVKIDVLDMFGRHLVHESSNLLKGELHKSIVLPDDLPGGIYILQVKNEEINERMQFILSR